MPLDLVARMGLDDAAFKAGLATSQNDVAKIAARTGQVIKAQTGGFVSLSRSISSVLGAATLITGWVGVIGYGLAQAFSYLDGSSEKQREIAEQANKEAEARARSLADVREQVLTQQQRGGGADADFAQIELIRIKYQKLIDQLPTLSTARILAGIASPQEIENLRLGNDLLAQMREEIEGIARARAISAGRLQTDTQVEILRLQGREAEALRLQEEQNHIDRLTRIRELRLENKAYEDRLREQERTRHRERIDQIEREAAEKKKADEERARQEAEQRERQAFENQALEKSLEIERLRLTGQENEARALERQVEHERRLEQIRRQPGLSTDERERLLESENRNYELRIRASQSEAQGRGLEARGVIAQASAVRGFFGPPPAANATTIAAKNTAIAETQAKTQQAIKEAVDSIKRAVEKRELQSGGAVFN